MRNLPLTRMREPSKSLRMMGVHGTLVKPAKTSADEGRAEPAVLPLLLKMMIQSK
jgi:hypothetical protein